MWSEVVPYRGDRDICKYPNVIGSMISLESNPYVEKKLTRWMQDCQEPAENRRGLRCQQWGKQMAKKVRLRARKSSGRMASKGFPNPIDVHVGNRIRLRRTLLSMSQEAVAESIGLTFQQVQKYEKGANRVSSSRLVDLAAVLDVDIPYFFAEMSAKVADQVPSQLIHTQQLPDTDFEKDPMARRETLELVRAYYGIPDPAMRKRLSDLVKAVARRAL